MRPGWMRRSSSQLLVGNPGLCAWRFVSFHFTTAITLYHSKACWYLQSCPACHRKSWGSLQTLNYYYLNLSLSFSHGFTYLRVCCQVLRCCGYGSIIKFPIPVIVMRSPYVEESGTNSDQTRLLDLAKFSHRHQSGLTKQSSLKDLTSRTVWNLGKRYEMWENIRGNGSIQGRGPPPCWKLSQRFHISDIFYDTGCLD